MAHSFINSSGYLIGQGFFHIRHMPPEWAPVPALSSRYVWLQSAQNDN